MTDSMLPTPMKKTHSYLNRVIVFDENEDANENPRQTLSKHINHFNNVLADRSNVHINHRLPKLSMEKTPQPPPIILHSARTKTIEKRADEEICGVLLKLKTRTTDDGQVQSVWNKRWFEVLSGYLVYSKSFETRDNPSGWLPLRKVSDVSLVEDGYVVPGTNRSVKNGFRVKTEVRDLILRAKSREIAFRWVQHLRQAVKEEREFSDCRPMPVNNQENEVQEGKMGENEHDIIAEQQQEKEQVVVGTASVINHDDKAANATREGCHSDNKYSEETDEWVADYDEEGNKFYYNVFTQESRWAGEEEEDQTAFEQNDEYEYYDVSQQQQAVQEEEYQQQHVDEGNQWEECYTEEGDVYYYNTYTQESSWEIPETYHQHK